MASPSRVEHPDGVTAETFRTAGLSAPQNRSPLREERDPYYEQPNDRARFYEREDQFEPRRRNAPRENFFDQRGREVPRDDYYEPRRMNAPRENYRGWQNQRQGGNQGGNSSYNTYRGNSNAPIPPQRDGPYRPPPTQRVGGYPPRDEPSRESFEEKMLRMMTDIKQEVSTVKHDMGHMRQEWKQEIRQEVSTVTKTITERARGALPSTTENNPRERVQAITLRSGKELPDPVLHKSSTSKSPIEEENVKIHVEENAEQNTGTVAPAGSHAQKALEKGKEKADVPVYRPPLPYPGRLKKNEDKTQYEPQRGSDLEPQRGSDLEPQRGHLRFHHQRVPLVILVCGTACVGKFTISSLLAHRLNLPNVLKIVERVGSSSYNQQEIDEVRDTWAKYFIDEWINTLH
nr:P-loop containing nucleoside triphosphate hydrolase superfamily protein [Ipomoea batatas]